MPLGIKDLFATEGVHTPACSHILDGFKPPYESTVTANLWADGAVMLGKLNMDEFAMGSSNETALLRPGGQSLRRSRAATWFAATTWARGLRLDVACAGAVLDNAGWCPAARRAARPRRSRRGCAPARPPPTPAARSASPPPSPAPSASSRPTAAARAGASSPSPPRSTRPGRSPATCATARSC